MGGRLKRKGVCFFHIRFAAHGFVGASRPRAKTEWQRDTDVVGQDEAGGAREGAAEW